MRKARAGHLHPGLCVGVGVTGFQEHPGSPVSSIECQEACSLGGATSLDCVCPPFDWLVLVTLALGNVPDTSRGL